MTLLLVANGRGFKEKYKKSNNKKKGYKKVVKTVYIEYPI